MDCFGRITLVFILRWKRACVLLTIAWVAHRYGQLYLHCSLIYFWVPSSCFLHSDQPLWGWNNPVQRCLPVGGGCIIHAGGGVGFTYRLTDCFLMRNRRRPAATSSRRASFSALASANSFVKVFCIERNRSNITLTHLHVSNCRVRQLQFPSLAFLSRWACR